MLELLPEKRFSGDNSNNRLQSIVAPICSVFSMLSAL
nr:MAG TPA: hypothetical protein [Caudoviricetes sp.]